MNHELISQICFTEIYVVPSHQTARSLFSRLPHGVAYADTLIECLASGYLIAVVESICIKEMQQYIDPDVEVAAALYVSKGLATATATDTSGDEFTTRLMNRLRSAVYRDAEQAALDLSAFRYLAQGGSGVNLRALSLDDVGLVLQRLPAGLRRWTWEDQKKTPNSTAQKWAVENEYHFQNLLYAVLAPVFHDLRDEEWLASVGQKKPRADLVIPSLHLVVEVKYWRVKHPPQDLISQIAEDVGLYLKRGSPYRKVLPIVWDQGRRTEQYDYLVSGLNEIRDIVTPVVIAQPGFMP